MTPATAATKAISSEEHLLHAPRQFMLTLAGMALIIASGVFLAQRRA